MSKSFLSLSSQEELEQWIEQASPGELDEFKRWEAAALKSLDEINGKAAVINQSIQSDRHPVDLAIAYDAIVSHNASFISQKKTHPLRDRFREIAAQEKALDPRGYIKRVSRLDEFKNIPPNTLRDWLK